MSIHDNVFDLMDALEARRRDEEVMQRIYAKPEWEKIFFLGYIQYLERHPELVEQDQPEESG